MSQQRSGKEKMKTVMLGSKSTHVDNKDVNKNM